MKKIVFVFLAVLITSGPLFARGQQGGTGGSSSTGLTTVRAWGMNKQYALDNRSISFSEWVNGTVDSRVFKAFTDEMAKLGVKIQYDLVMEDQIAVAFQTMLASGQINNYDWIAPVDVDTKTRYSLINQKALYPLNQAIQQYSTGAAKDFFYSDPSGRQLAKLNTVQDGNFYWISQHAVSNGSPVASSIRKDWLDKLSLPVPSTLDEFYNTILAFHERDANGNGLRDEVASIRTDNFSTGFAQWFGIGRDRLVSPIDGRAVSPWYQTHVRDYFTFLNKMYRAGLLDIGQSGGSNVSNVIIENRAGYYGAYVRDNFTEPTVVTPAGAPKAHYWPLIIQAYPDTDARIIDEGGAMQWLGSGMYAATANTKNIQAIVKMMDFFETPAYMYLTEVGLEGYTYRWNADLTYTRLPVSSNADTDQQLYWQALPGLWSGWQGIFPRVNRSDPAKTPSVEAERAASLKSFNDVGMSLGYADGTHGLGKYKLLTEFEDGKYKKIFNSDGVLAFPTVQEADRINELTPDLDTYASELITALVMGEKSLNNWDSYIADLKRLGLDEIVSIYQARMDRAK
jgi:hypothetical protein